MFLSKSTIGVWWLEDKSGIMRPFAHLWDSCVHWKAPNACSLNAISVPHPSHCDNQ